MAELTDRGLAPKTIRTYWGRIRTILDWCIEEGLAPRDQTRRVQLPDKPDYRKTDLDQISSRRMAKILGATPERFEPFMEFLYRTGLRMGEAVALEVDKVRVLAPGTVLADGDHDSIAEFTVAELGDRTGALIIDQHLTQGYKMADTPTKNGHELILPVTSETLRLIRFQLDTYGPARGGFVFSGSRGGRLNVSGFYHHVLPVIREVAGDRFRPHSCRAAFTTDIRRLVSKEVADALVNHLPDRRDVSANHYDYVSWEERVAAVEAREAEIAPYLPSRFEVEEVAA